MTRVRDETVITLEFKADIYLDLGLLSPPFFTSKNICKPFILTENMRRAARLGELPRDTI